jgi:hypothetical protein
VTSPTEFHELLTMDTDLFDDERAAVARNADGAASADQKVQEEAFKDGWQITADDGHREFFVYHHWGDPTCYDHVVPLFQEAGRQFDTVIVMGNVVGGDLPGDAKDSRVLSMCLIFRRLVGELGYGMHVVGENHHDQTSLLAVVPKRRNDDAPARLYDDDEDDEEDEEDEDLSSAAVEGANDSGTMIASRSGVRTCRS